MQGDCGRAAADTRRTARRLSLSPPGSPPPVHLPACMNACHACMPPPVSFTLRLPIARDLLMTLMQEMEVGSCIGVCEVSSSPLSLWKGKTRVKLFVRYFSSAPTSRLSLTVSASLLIQVASFLLSLPKTPHATQRKSCACDF
jgi:hypothetical protein